MRIRTCIVLLVLLSLLPSSIVLSQRAPNQVRLLVARQFADIVDEMEQIVRTYVPNVNVAITVDEGPLGDMAQRIDAGRYDVIVGDSFQRLTAVLLPLDPLLARSGVARLDLQPARINGTVYGLPLSYEPHVIVYNADLFDRHGIAYPTDHWTWNDLIQLIDYFQASEANMTHGIAVPSTSLGNLWTHILYQSGTEPLYAHTADLQHSFSIAKALHASAPVAYSFGHTLEPAFVRGEAPFHWVAFSDVQRQFYYDVAGSLFRLPFAWDVVPLPLFIGGEPVNHLASVPSVGITVFAADLATAWDIVNVLAEYTALGEGYRYGPPALRTDESTLNRWANRALPFISDAERTSLIAVFQRQPVYFVATETEQATAIRAVMREALAAVLLGEISDEEALAEVLQARSVQQ